MLEGNWPFPDSAGTQDTEQATDGDSNYGQWQRGWETEEMQYQDADDSNHKYKSSDVVS